VLNKFKAEQQLNFSLLSDFNKEVSTAYDVLYETFSYNMKGVSKRAAFVIDVDGMVRYAEVCSTPADQPDFNAIQQVLNTLK
jgi:glutaredoxin-dependent peroxiredoxin